MAVCPSRRGTHSSVRYVPGTDSPRTDPARLLTSRFLAVNGLILLLALLIIPAVLLWADRHDEVGGKYSLIPLVLINPVLFLVLSAVAARRSGVWAGLFIVAALGFFALSTLIVYNESALIYALFYLPVALLGWGAGTALRAARVKSVAP